MKLRNTPHGYGLVSIFLHWVMAILLVGLFALGIYMVNLDYYHPWYHKAPDLHRDLGVVAAVLLVLRLGWRLHNPLPAIHGAPWEQCTAVWVHRSFYVLIAANVISGYLISTADGHALPVFGWFEIPATIHGIENQEDIAGMAHQWLAYGLIALAVFHSLAALKHHFIDHDPTLRRMLSPREAPSPVSSTTHITEE